jgi:hypothetical protein
MRKGTYVLVLLLFLFLFWTRLGLFNAPRLCNVLQLRRPGGGGGDSGSERGWEVAACTACLDLLWMVLEKAHLCLISRSFNAKYEYLHLLDLVRGVNCSKASIDHNAGYTMEDADHGSDATPGLVSIQESRLLTV